MASSSSPTGKKEEKSIRVYVAISTSHTMWGLHRENNNSYLHSPCDFQKARSHLHSPRALPTKDLNIKIILTFYYLD